jgi:hypothetical protein
MKEPGICPIYYWALTQDMKRWSPRLPTLGLAGHMFYKGMTYRK